MKINWYNLGLMGCAFFGGLAIQALPSLKDFEGGTRISAADMNANFDEVLRWAGEQEKVAGYLTKDGSNTTIPFYRKIITGPSKTTDTTNMAHGLGNVASGRRIIHCDVMVNYSGGTTIALNLTNGSATAAWCDFDDTNLEVKWVTATPHDSGQTYYVLVDYVKAW